MGVQKDQVSFPKTRTIDPAEAVSFSSLTWEAVVLLETPPEPQDFVLTFVLRLG